MLVTLHLQPLVSVQLLHVVSTTGRIRASCLTHALTTTNTPYFATVTGQVHVCSVKPINFCFIFHYFKMFQWIMEFFSL